MEITKASVEILSYNCLVKFEADGEGVKTEMNNRKTPKEAMIEAINIYKESHKNKTTEPAIEEVKVEENSINEEIEATEVDVEPEAPVDVTDELPEPETKKEEEV